jgi:hypothetical protein
MQLNLYSRIKIKIMKPWLSRLLKGYSAITLYPFGVYIQPGMDISEVTIRHEVTHLLQQREMLVIPFYIWYYLEWLIRRPFDTDAYFHLSFEQEAYKNDTSITYNQTRKHYSWLKYI